MNDLESEIRAHLYEVLDGSAPLDDFEQWFVGRAWDERSELASDIDAVLVERSSIDPGELLVALKEIVANIATPATKPTIEAGSIAMLVTSASSSSVAMFQGRRPFGNETIRRHVELAGK